MKQAQIKLKESVFSAASDASTLMPTILLNRKQPQRDNNHQGMPQPRLFTGKSLYFR
jgi:hypothetical protein